MFKKLSLRTQVTFFVVCILIAFLAVQVSLYGVLQNKSSQIISTVFYSISQNTRVQVESANQEIAELTFLLSTHDTIQDVLYEYEHYEVIKKLHSVQLLLNDYLARNKSIRSLTVVKDNEHLATADDTTFSDEINTYIENNPITGNASKDSPSYFQYNGKTYFVCRTTIIPTNVHNRIYTNDDDFIVCIYELNSVNHLPYSFIDNEQIKLIITDSDSNIILSPDATQIGQQIEDTNRKDILSQSFSIEGTNWQGIVSMPTESVSGLSSASITFIWVAVAFIGLLTLSLLYFLKVTLIKRMLIVKNSVTSISQNSGNSRIQYEYNDEFNEIATAFNKLLSKIDSLNNEKIASINNLYAAKLMQKETHIYYLYNQVSPHFLYNTMSHIQGLAFQYDADEIVKITTEFSKIFRYCSSSQTHSTIKEDLDYAISYFNIVNSRRENPLSLSVQIDEDLYSISCLKMIFQPILENSLKYAFPPDEDGQITITSLSTPEKVILEFKDDGCGILPEALHELEKQFSECDPNRIQESNHIGLSNIHTRLKLYYQNDSGLNIQSSFGEGTCVQIFFDRDLPQKQNSEI